MNASDLRLGALGLVALVLAGISGWSRALPGPGVAAAARAQAWAPIDWKPSDGAANARLLAQRNTWGGPAPRAIGVATTLPQPGAAAPPAQTGPWRIVGTADWGEGLAAIVQTQPPGAQKPQFVFRRAGENLPDGRVVVRVDPGGVEARQGTGEPTRIFLFRPR
jgi:hypothetical protein